MSTHETVKGHGHEPAKPCPFCASSDVALYDVDERVWWRVECLDCGAAGPLAGTEDDGVTVSDNKDAAVDAWKRRPRRKRVPHA